jgi:Fur family transcriptional regulator, ferric uptake regulator
MNADLHAIAEERLLRAGQRYTAKRRSLVEALRGAGNPVAVPDLVAAHRDLPQSSAYRNLGVLEEVGVARRVVTEEGIARFELAEDLTEHHHHLVCRVCGAVEDVRVPARLEGLVDRALAEAAERVGFRGLSHRVDLLGTCRDCTERYGER